MQELLPSHVWQRRTHKIIALAVIIIGLTMMISSIPQCIYVGLIFIMLSLGWLTWMKLTDKKLELSSSHHHPSTQPHGNLSPVLFLVASQNFSPQRTYGPTTHAADPNDKPPSYDQILKLDGLPPDYVSSILSTKPPRYEDVASHDIKWPMTIPIEVDLGTPVPVHHSVIATSVPPAGDSSDLAYLDADDTSCQDHEMARDDSTEVTADTVITIDSVVKGEKVSST